MTACGSCKHLVNERNGSKMWYDLYCGAKAVRRPSVFDPLTGTKVGEDHGGMPHVRDINRGDCPHFQKKRWFK